MTPRSVFFDYINPFLPWLLIAGVIVLIDLSRENRIFYDGGTVEDYDEVDWNLLDEANTFCTSPDRVIVLSQMVELLDSDFANSTRFDLFESDEIVVVMTSPSSMSVSTGAMESLTKSQLAALMAHEIGHMRNGDIARFERSETMYNLLVTPDLDAFSEEQEELADQEAMDMMIEAGIPTEDIVALFGATQAGRVTNFEFQTTAHPGLPAREDRWAMARTQSSAEWNRIDPIDFDAECTPVDAS